MMILNARRERISDGQNSWEQYSVPLDSHLHKYVEHALLQSREQLQTIVNTIQEAKSTWRISHVEAPIARIVEVYSKCITVKKQLAKFKTFNTKQREYIKLVALQTQLQPYIDVLQTTLTNFQQALDSLQAAHEKLVAFAAIPGMGGLVLFNRWTVSVFVEFTERLLQLLHIEMQQKRYIELRLVTTMDRGELRKCRKIWINLHNTDEFRNFIRLLQDFEDEIQSQTKD